MKFFSFLSNRPWKFHLAVIAVGLLADQITKLWAVKTFSTAEGEPNYFHVVSVVGEWIQFRLVYNPGAAFGLQPQKLAPFIHPTLFFSLISLLALVGLFFFYRSITKEDRSGPYAVALITAGAFGNLTDRLRLHKVVDFIDVGIPGFDPRWPTFNVADSMVSVGVCMLVLLPLLTRKIKPPKTP